MYKELFRKSIALVTAFVLVFGVYFASGTKIAKVSFEKVTKVFILSMNTVAGFDTKYFAEDIAVNIYKGMDKAKPDIASKLSYDSMQNISANTLATITDNVKIIIDNKIFYINYIINEIFFDDK